MSASVGKHGGQGWCAVWRKLGPLFTLCFCIGEVGACLAQEVVAETWWKEGVSNVLHTFDERNFFGGGSDAQWCVQWEKGRGAMFDSYCEIDDDCFPRQRCESASSHITPLGGNWFFSEYGQERSVVDRG